MTAYATNAFVVRFSGKAPSGAIGLVFAADAVKYEIKALWATFGADGWTTGEGWLPATDVEFLSRDQFADELRALHDRMAQTGRVVRYLPDCGHTSSQAAYRHFCACDEGERPRPGSIAIADDTSIVAGRWVTYDPTHGAAVRVHDGRASAAEVREIDADEFAELLKDAPTDPWPALLALGTPGVSNSQQDLLREHAADVMPGLVRVGEVIAAVVADDGDELVVHMIGSGAGTLDVARDHIDGDRDPVVWHGDDNRFDSEVETVIYAGNILGRVSKSLTSPVGLNDWLRFHDRTFAHAYDDGAASVR